MEQGRSFGVNSQVIAVVRSTNCAKNVVEITYAWQAAKGFYGLLMRFQNVAELDPVVTLTDQPTA